MEFQSTKTFAISTYVYQREQRQYADQHLELTRGLDDLRNRNVFCDVTISVGERYFPAHKAVLAASSRYFNAMFTSGFREACQGTIGVHGIPEVFEVLLQFIYTGKLSLNPMIAHLVLQMACYLQLDIASQVCTDYLIKCFRNRKIKFEDALKISLVVECLPDSLELKDWCHYCISENFTKIQHLLTDDNQYLVNSELMGRMLDRNDLPACEEQVLRTVLVWIKHDLEHRKTRAIDLLRKVRIGLIPEQKLFDIIVEDLPELLSVQECYRMLEKIFAKQDGDLKHMFTTRTAITAFVIPDNHTYTTYYLDSQHPGDRPQWRKLTNFASMPVRKLYSCNTLVVCEHLYLAGGILYREPGSDDSSDEEESSPPVRMCQTALYRYSPKENQWQRLQDMKVARYQFAFVHLNEDVYAIGGISGNDSTKNVERYSMTGKEWEHLPPMPEEAHMGYSSAVSFRGKILVYAAETRTMKRSMMSHYLQVFDPETRLWQVLLTEKHVQGSLPSALVVHKDKCYRVIYKNSKCKSEDFGWPTYNVCVHELLLDDTDGDFTARIGNTQDQSAIPEDQGVGAFCIQDDIFVTVNGVIHKTDDKVNNGHRQVNFDKWKWSTTIGPENCVVKFTFDRALLE